MKDRNDSESLSKFYISVCCGNDVAIMRHK